MEGLFFKGFLVFSVFRLFKTSLCRGFMAALAGVS